MGKKLDTMPGNSEPKISLDQAYVMGHSWRANLYNVPKYRQVGGRKREYVSASMKPLAVLNDGFAKDANRPEYQSYRMTKINELYKPLLDNHLEAIASSNVFSSRRSLGASPGAPTFQTSARLSQATLKKVDSRNKAHTGFYIHNTLRKQSQNLDLANHSLNTCS